ncbi:MAG TPA: YHS domain-containing protein [Candidatus Brocadiia bacterium]|nr:YHS domain-containing protein [Planctomycetota bacterium]MBI4007947.1 YHS domain-containing protein [Planctomycetota bacterium]MDO8093848.1 YHS domain-containing protein [Candidatus Brocadiales bacterium]
MKRIFCLASIIAFFVALTIGYSGRTLFACGGCSTKAEHPQAQVKNSPSLVRVAEGAETLTDPVCTMEVKKDPEKSIEHEGYTYYFCSKACMEKFKGDTKKYACPCVDIKPGCNCYHCTGKGVACECLKELKKKGEKHEHKHEGGEEHPH